MRLFPKYLHFSKIFIHNIAVMVSSYTANLAMFLVIENKTSKINGIEDLQDCGVPGKECPIKFGAKRGGATFSFFKVYLKLNK